MRLVILGHPRPVTANRWKDDAAEAGEALGWQVTHMPARGVDADDVVREAKQADLFLWARTHGHCPNGDVAGMLRRIEDAGTPTVGVHLDLYWGIGRREQEIGAHPWWTCQTVFTADGGDRPWTSRGVNHRWMPPPMGLRFYGRAAPAARYAHRAVFVGRWIRDIHGQHRKGLLDWARRSFGTEFVHYGRFGKHQAWGAELSALYATAWVALGDSAYSPNYWSDRLPCTLGRGGLLAYPHTPGLAEQGFTNETMILYRPGRYEQIGARLAGIDDRERRRLTDNALTLIGERHLWTHRLLDVQRDVLG